MPGDDYGDFGLAEYSVVLAALMATSSVGLYFSRSGKRSLESYMFGNRTLSVLPISLSIVATFFTGLNQTALAQESYLYGSQPAMISVGFLIAALVSTTFYLPVLHQFKNVSSFQYFERRFNQHVRKFVSVVFIFDAVQRAALSIYIPSAAFSEATGLPMLQIAAALSVVCLVCSAIGGLKSVAWSDSLQAAILIVCTICFLFLGVSKAGGAAEVIQKAEEGGRFEFFNFDPSPYTRYTLWGAILGKGVTCILFSLSPTFHQRYMSVRSYRQSVRVIWCGCIITASIVFVSWMSGTLVYAYFAGCDPVLAKQGKSYKMIYPYFVSKVTRGLPGLTGLFHASLMASGMSTATSFWNTVSCTIYEDFIRPKWDLSEKASYRILILLVLIFSVLSGGGVVLASTFPSLYEANAAFQGLSHTAMFVLYNASLFLPWVNATGVLSGAVTGALATLTIIIGSIRAQRRGLMRDVHKVLTTEYCYDTLANSSTIATFGTPDYGIQKMADSSVFWAFKISLCFYTLSGFLVGMVVAVVVSFLTSRQPLNELNPNLIVPQMRWVLPKKAFNTNTDLADTPMLEVQSTSQERRQET